MPTICFACAQVTALVDRVAANVVAPALMAGMDRLSVAGKTDLFAGVIIGWEANPSYPAYHSFKVMGYASTTSLSDVSRLQQQLNHDYLQRWTKTLFDEGIPKKKIYTHTVNLTQFQIDHMYSDKDNDWLLTNVLASGPDSFWVPFDDYANGGFSAYEAASMQGTFEAIWAEADAHRSAWALSEGTNLDHAISWETYLGKVFNHGGTLANIFGGFFGNTSEYQAATESSEAVAAYQKFLSGGRLAEAP